MRKWKMRWCGVSGWLLGMLIWCSAPQVASAAVPMRLVHDPALSPDGKQLAMSWRGDLWVADASGGAARRLTSTAAFETKPLWSPDGRQIAFRSGQGRNVDIFVIDATGGEARQLTYHPAADTPIAWAADSKSLLFASGREWGGVKGLLLYRVPITGGTPTRVLRVPLVDGALSPDGKQLVFVTGDRRWWRKRYTMPFHRHLWWVDLTSQKLKRLSYGQTSDSPAWIDNKQIVFRKEVKGVTNVFVMDLATGKQRALTSWTQTGLRRVHTVKGAGQVIATYWDQVWRIDLKTNKRTRLRFSAMADHGLQRLHRKVARGPVADFAVSPSGKEVAVVVKGDLFVTDQKDPDKMARPIAASSAFERQPSWSPDGRMLAYTSDESGLDAIFLVHACRDAKGKVKSLFGCHPTKVLRRRFTPVGETKRG